MQLLLHLLQLVLYLLIVMWTCYHVQINYEKAKQNEGIPKYQNKFSHSSKVWSVGD